MFLSTSTFNTHSFVRSQRSQAASWDAILHQRKQIMKLRTAIVFLLRASAGVLSLAVTAYGVYSFTAADLLQDTALIFFFCFLPALSFPVFVLSMRWPKISNAAQWVIAAAYLAVYSQLDWRTCAEAGYCDGVARNILLTLRTRPVEASIAVAALTIAALLMREKLRSAPRTA
jgi:hypothetical protein